MPKPGRLYVALDVHYYDDARIVEVSPLAELLYVRALCAAKKLGTAGRLTRRQVDRIAPPGAVVPLPDELVAAGLWAEEDGAYVITAWDEWHGEAAFEAAARGNHVRWHERRGKVDPSCRFCSSSPDHRPESPPESPPTPRRNRNTEQSRAEQSTTTGARARARDELFEAVVVECGVDVDALTKSGRGAVNKAVGELRAVGATPDEVGRRAATYRRKYGAEKLTTSALAKHWGTLHPSRTRQARRDPGDLSVHPDDL